MPVNTISELDPDPEPGPEPAIAPLSSSFASPAALHGRIDVRCAFNWFVNIMYGRFSSSRNNFHRYCIFFHVML